MSFEEYQLRIRRLCSGATAPVLQQFCADVLGRMLKHVKEMDMESLFERERELIEQLIRQAESRAPDWRKVQEIIDELSRIAESDEMHAVETSSDFVNFLGAMEHWAHYLQTGDPKSAVEVSEEMMNVLDGLYVTNTELAKWLETPEISQEFSKQIAFLSDGTKHS